MIEQYCRIWTFLAKYCRTSSIIFTTFVSAAPNSQYWSRKGECLILSCVRTLQNNPACSQPNVENESGKLKKGHSTRFLRKIWKRRWRNKWRDLKNCNLSPSNIKGPCKNLLEQFSIDVLLLWIRIDPSIHLLLSSYPLKVLVAQRMPRSSRIMSHDRLILSLLPLSRSHHQRKSFRRLSLYPLQPQLHQQLIILLEGSLCLPIVLVPHMMWYLASSAPWMNSPPEIHQRFLI
ncbi:unnamed protein product [Cylicostephanus goldi]|uniref:Uncharacterized protein n=1 Tax=Cylicostephanus goldi TaxID=71465 RepID=A0A3P6QLI1_CYLGO|nr:unnamed protein product [Cylicostephanus goldi]